MDAVTNGNAAVAKSQTPTPTPTKRDRRSQMMRSKALFEEAMSEEENGGKPTSKHKEGSWEYDQEQKRRKAMEVRLFVRSFAVSESTSISISIFITSNASHCL